MTHIKMRH